MTTTNDSLQKTKKKDELEIKAMTLNNQDMKHQRQLDTLNNKVGNINRKNNNNKNKNKKMQITITTLKLMALRVNQIKSENFELEGQHSKIEKKTRAKHYSKLVKLEAANKELASQDKKGLQILKKNQ